MLQRVLLRLLAVLFGLALGLGICELAVRRMIVRDADGNCVVASRYFRPYRLPLRRVQELLRVYRSVDSTRVIYSPTLGWDSRPVVSWSGGRRLESPGFRASRSPTDYTPAAPLDTVRIALFGDSFTACATPQNETWGQYVETDFLSRHEPVQVLNFGMGGYGIDQAYLKWKEYGRTYHPDIVIFGFQPENAMRDLNLIRLLYAMDTGLPFLKPRFVLEAGRLRLVYPRAAPPESLASILASLREWPLLPYERFYSPGDYRDRWWLKSRLVAFSDAILRTRGGSRDAWERELFDPDREGGKLALEIIRQFQMDVESTGAAFLVVHLPRKEDLARLHRGGRRLNYQGLLEILKRRCRVVETSTELLRTAGGTPGQRLFGRGAHYDGRRNRAVADAVVSYLQRHGTYHMAMDAREDAARPGARR